jgi:excisionase family DNA binding protein
MRGVWGASPYKEPANPHYCSGILDIGRMSIVANRPLGLSTSQAARELGVSLGTIRRWSDLGYLHAYRTPGGQRRFSREQIDDFVRSLEESRRPLET